MGWTYNTINPDAETNAPTIAAVGISFTTLSLVLVALRMYGRLYLVRRVGADDWVIVFTWFMSCGFTVVTIMQTKWGLGLQNLHDMPLENIFNFGLLQYAGAPFYITSILGFKLSLLLTFLRIAVERSYRMVIMFIFAACTAFHLSFLLVQLMLCTPISKQWDPAVVGGSCVKAVPFYTSMASITILFDVIIIITPFPMLIKLQLPKRKKVVLLGLFSLGAFITIIQIIRILKIKSLANYLDSSALIMWSMVENNIGIAITCVPHLAPLIKAFAEKSANRSNAQNTHTKGTGSAYALQSIGGGKSMRGFVGIGSGIDKDDRRKERSEHSVVRLGDMESSSEELHVPRRNAIQKTTEVMVSRNSIGENGKLENASKYPYTN